MKYKCVSCGNGETCLLNSVGDPIAPKYCPFDPKIGSVKWVEQPPNQEVRRANVYKR